MSVQLCLKWNNRMKIMDEFKDFLLMETMVDVTLACDGLSLKAHKIVLSACSHFFKSLFLENPCKHPIVILTGVKYAELKAVVEFMYYGEICVAEDQFSILLKTARTLGVKGLGEIEPENNQSCNEPNNISDDEPETVSCGNSLQQSVCTVDVSNSRFTRKQLVTEQNDGNFEPEIELEVLSDNIFSNSSNACASVASVKPLSANRFKSQHEREGHLTSQVSKSNLLEETLSADNSLNACGSVAPVKTRSANRFKFQQKRQGVQVSQTPTPNLLEQIFTPDPLLKQSPAHSSIKLDEECTDRSSNSVSSIDVTPDISVDDSQQPGTSTASPHKRSLRRSKLRSTLEKPAQQSRNSQGHKVNDSVSKNAVVKTGSTNSLSKSPVIKTESTNPISKNVVINTENSNGISKKPVIKTGNTYSISKKAVAKNGNIRLARRNPGSINCRKRDFTCAQCPFKTVYSESLKRHILTRHDKIKRFNCDQCSYAAALKQNLVRHIAEVHGCVIRFQCTLCPYKCAQQGNLKRHTQSVHDGSKRFKCDHCSFRASQKESIKKHTVAVHEKRRDHACLSCTYRSATSENLRRHVRLMHEKKELQTNIK